MNQKLKGQIELAAYKLTHNQQAVQSLLEELVEFDSVHFDDAGNPYWAICGEPVINGVPLFFKD